MTKPTSDLFEKELKASNLSNNTITSYKTTVKQFYSMHRSITSKDLLQFKAYLIDH